MQHTIDDLILSINTSLLAAGEQPVSKTQLDIICRQTTDFTRRRDAVYRGMNANQQSHNTPRFQRGGTHGR